MEGLPFDEHSYGHFMAGAFTDERLSDSGPGRIVLWLRDRHWHVMAGQTDEEGALMDAIVTIKNELKAIGAKKAAERQAALDHAARAHPDTVEARREQFSEEVAMAELLAAERGQREPHPDMNPRDFMPGGPLPGMSE